MNTEVVNTESLLPGKCRLRFLPASGHAIFVNQSIHNLVLCVFLLKIPYLVFSHSVVSDSFWPHGLQHARLPCPSPSPGACSNSYPLSQWCHPTISSSVIPFSFRLQSFPAPGSFPISQLFTSGGQSIGASASVLPKNIQGWFPSVLTTVNTCSPRDSQESSQHHSSKASVLWHSGFFYCPALTSVHDYWKNHSFDYMDLCRQSNVSPFSYAAWVCHCFSSKEQGPFNFMAAWNLQWVWRWRK